MRHKLESFWIYANKVFCDLARSRPSSLEQLGLYQAMWHYVGMDRSTVCPGANDNQPVICPWLNWMISVGKKIVFWLLLLFFLNLCAKSHKDTCQILCCWITFTAYKSKGNSCSALNINTLKYANAWLKPNFTLSLLLLQQRLKSELLQDAVEIAQVQYEFKMLANDWYRKSSNTKCNHFFYIYLLNSLLYFLTLVRSLEAIIEKKHSSQHVSRDDGPHESITLC